MSPRGNVDNSGVDGRPDRARVERPATTPTRTAKTNASSPMSRAFISVLPEFGIEAMVGEHKPERPPTSGSPGLVCHGSSPKDSREAEFQESSPTLRCNCRVFSTST